MPRTYTLRLTALVLAALAAAPGFGAEEGHTGHEQDATPHGDHAAPHADHAASQTSGRIGDPYPLSTDPVTGESLSEVEEPVVLLHEGRELRFTDAKSIDTFKAAPEKYLAQVDEQIIKSQMPYYPMTTCPVSSDKLGGEMGDPIDFVYGNRLIRFCCKSCKGDFLADSSAMLEKLDAAAIAQQKENYPLETCPVSGEKLGPMRSISEPRNVVIANRLVRLCCPECKGTLMANPAKVLAEVDAAWEQSGAKPGAEGAGNAEDGHGDHGKHKAGEGAADGHGQHGVDKERHGGDAKKGRQGEHAGHNH